MPKNPNTYNFGGIAFIHREPEGTQKLIEIPRLYEPSDDTILDFDVTARRTLEIGDGSPKVYILGMYHAAVLNALLILGDTDQEREKWQSIQRLNGFLENPANNLAKLSPTALRRTIESLDALASDAIPGTEFVEQKMKTKNTSEYRIYPGIGLNDVRH
jgi:hypothetical protein